MSSQIIKKQIPNEFIFSFLEHIYAFKTNKYYIINSTSYKKAVFKDILDCFIDFIKPYYYNSKMYYLVRKMSFNRFLTILRQLCNFNGIVYKNEVKYSNSRYDIQYTIYFNEIIDDG